MWADDVTSRDIVIADPDEKIVAAAERMAAEGVRHVAVVDKGMVVGVVSARDVLAILTSHARSTL